MCCHLFAAPKAFDPLKQLSLELLTEDDVDEDVYRGVEGDELKRIFELSVNDVTSVGKEVKDIVMIPYKY